MLIDGRTLPPDRLVRTDLCIVGGGAAGITLALAFAGDRDIDVCLVESGGLDFDADVQELYRGQTIGVAYEPYDTRLRYFGGSTNHWGGWCRPLEEMDFEARPWVPHSGWPIGLAELAPYYTEAGALCEVPGLGREAGTWSERLGLPALALADSRLRHMMFLVSSPTRFGEVYRERLLAAANLTICLHSNVIGFKRSPQGALVDRVQVATLTDNRFEIAARCFVLACGGIENARLLLCSKSMEGGLPDPYDLVGRYFMEHAHFDLGRLALSRAWDPRFYLQGNRVAGEERMEVNAHLGLRSEVEAREQIATIAVQMRPRLPSHGEKSLQRIWGSLM